MKRKNYVQPSLTRYPVETHLMVKVSAGFGPGEDGGDWDLDNDVYSEDDANNTTSIIRSHTYKEVKAKDTRFDRKINHIDLWY